MDPLLRSTLCQRVAYAASTGLSAEQVPTYGTPVFLAARVETANSISYGSAGRMVTPGTLVITETEIPKDAALWLPPNADGATPTGSPVMVVRSTPRVDARGAVHHWETEV